MIIKGQSCNSRPFWATHLMNKSNDRVRLVEFKGVLADSVDGALREWEAQAQGTRCKNYFYEVSISPDEGDMLTDPGCLRCADIAEERFGLQGQPRFIAET